MKYDFETVADQIDYGFGTDYREDTTVMAGAQLHVKTAPCIIEGLTGLVQSGLYGWTSSADPQYISAIVRWMRDVRNWEIQSDWIVPSYGTLQAMCACIRAFTEPGDGIIVQQPVYVLYERCISNCGRRLVDNTLIRTGDHYEMDFDDLDAKMADPRNRLMILCNPHNPVGRVWTREELTRVCELCLQNDVFLISDEIHLDLILPGYEGTSVGQLGEPYVRNAAICTAPSKTFNIAGLQVSNILIADPARREKMENSKGYFSLNMFSYKACEVVYRECEPWLDALLHVLDENQRSMRAALDAMGAGIRMSELQGTYLAWLDMRSLGLDDAALERFLRQEARWFINPGPGFGPGGEGHVRVNIACPAHTLQEALQRLHAALQKLPAYQK